MYKNIQPSAFIVEFSISLIKRIKHLIYSKKNYTHFSLKDLHRDNVGKKVVLYSCITGKYDVIYSPLLNLPNIDYILYTDSVLPSKNSKWKTREIPKFLQHFSPNDQNRYIKMHPHEFFSGDYDYSIYIDGKIHLLGDVFPLTNSINKKTGLALFQHGTRENVYSEAEVLIKLQKGNVKKIREQMERYKNVGFPEDSGLFEMAVIASDLSNSVSEKLLDSWWKEYIVTESLRDQISWPYILWRNNFSKEDIGYLGVNYEDKQKWIMKGHRN